MPVRKGVKSPYTCRNFIGLFDHEAVKQVPAPAPLCKRNISLALRLTNVVWPVLFLQLVFCWQRDFALWFYAYQGNLVEVRRRLHQGGNPDARWQGLPALAGAIHFGKRTGDNRVALLLIDRGATLTPYCLRYAVRWKSPEIVARMIAKGADVRGEAGSEALISAVYAGNTETVALLLRHGANPNAREDGRTGRTVLQIAHRVDANGKIPDPVTAHTIAGQLRAAGAVR